MSFDASQALQSDTKVGGHLEFFKSFRLKSLWLFLLSLSAKSAVLAAPATEASVNRVAALRPEIVPLRYKSDKLLLNLFLGCSLSLSDKKAFLENI